MIAHYTYGTTAISVHRSVEDQTLRLVETPPVIEWHVEDADIVRFMESANKISWVKLTKLATKDRQVPSLSVCVKAYDAISKGVEAGTIVASKTWSVRYGEADDTEYMDAMGYGVPVGDVALPTDSSTFDNAHVAG